MGELDDGVVGRCRSDTVTGVTDFGGGGVSDILDNFQFLNHIISELI